MKNKCLYCDNKTTEKTIHFVSACCGRGMCDECYNGLVGTMEQFQIDHMDKEDYDKHVKGTNIEGKGDYICFDCLDNGNIIKLK